MSSKTSYYGGGNKSFLLSAFTQFSYFSFDKAKEQVDKEKDVSSKQGPSSWLSLLSCISQLASVEKLYTNLTFLTPKGFLRKECSVKMIYESILTDLVEIEKSKANMSPSQATKSSSEKSCSKAVIVHISSQIILYIQARLLMLSFYERLIHAASTKYIKYSELLLHIEDIIKKNARSFHHPDLAPVKTTFTYESEICSHFLVSLKAMQEMNFLRSLLNLNEAHTKLNLWQNIVQQNRESKIKYSFLKSNSQPLLFDWFLSTKSAIMSKFSLYFYEVLSNQTSFQDTKTLMSRLTLDYAAKIQNLQRKWDATNIFLLYESPRTSVFDPNASSMTRKRMIYSMEDYRMNPNAFGYRFPGRDQCSESPKYEKKCPVFFAAQTPIPNEQLGSVLRIIFDRHYLDFEKVFISNNSDKSLKYFIQHVESNIYIVAIFETAKIEKEIHISEFLNEITNQLRCNKIFAALKIT